jgi:PPK2 family polyphosphate:nucleotide phosphotransferase
MNVLQRLRVKPGERARLSGIDPGGTPGGRSKAAAQAEIEKNDGRIFDLQYRLYAEHRRALLIVLQGSDASGKDGTIRHVMRGMNPQGCRVTSFKVPTSEELDHDYLWRIVKALPARGEVGIFNRSHYEDVLVVRVHDLVPKDAWSRRYDQINAFEKHLTENGTTVLKLYLHVSREEQAKRLAERIDDPTKNWKVNPGDFEEAKLWNDYQAAAEDALTRCSTPWAPWFVIPADHKWYRNLAVSRIVLKTLADMKPRFPKPTVDLDALRKESAKALRRR